MAFQLQNKSVVWNLVESFCEVKKNYVDAVPGIDVTGDFVQKS